MAHTHPTHSEWATDPAVQRPPLTLVPTPPAGAVTADLSGTIRDSQVAIGNGNTQISTGGGDCIVNQSVHRPPQPRAEICVLPRTQPELLGRDAEVRLALGTVAERQPVQFHGGRGVGKSALLRHVAHASSRACPEGIVYFRASHTSLDDLLQTLFDFLFESETPTKRTPGQLASDLARWEVLFVLDDVDLDEDDLETLLDTVPMSAFVLSSRERTLWGAGEAAELRGLPESAARALYEARLRRPLTERELADFPGRWRALDGLPAQLVKDAERLRSGAQAGAPAPGGPVRLAKQIVSELAPGDRDLLELTAALGGIPLSNAHLAELSGQPDAAAKLARLEDRGLTQSHSPRYSATVPGAGLLDDGEALRLRMRLLAYFIDRAERGAIDPARPRDDLDPIVALLRWGRTAAPHADVLRLARASDTIAARAGMWDAWRTILDIGLESARAIGDRSGEAWALHQLGTRALCLEDRFGARCLLREALDLRERIGDRPGAANTRHNLRFLPGGPAAPDGSEDGSPLGPRPDGQPGAGAAGGGGLGATLLAPFTWLWLLVPVLMLAGGIAAASALPGGGARTQDVRTAGPLLHDRPARSTRCATRGACATPPACSAARSCPPDGADEDRRTEPRDPSPGHPSTSPPAAPVPTVGVSDPDPVDPGGDAPPGDPPVDEPPDAGPDDVGPAVVPIDSTGNSGTIGSSEIVDSALAPSCDHVDSVVRFVQRELGLPGKLLGGLELAEVVQEQIDIVRELVEGLKCGKAVTSALLAQLLVPDA